MEFMAKIDNVFESVVNWFEPRVFELFAHDEVIIQMVKGWHYEFQMRGKSYVKLVNDAAHDVDIAGIKSTGVIIPKRPAANQRCITLVANFRSPISHASCYEDFSRNHPATIVEIIRHLEGSNETLEIGKACYSLGLFLNNTNKVTDEWKWYGIAKVVVEPGQKLIRLHVTPALADDIYNRKMDFNPPPLRNWAWEQDDNWNPPHRVKE